MVNKTLSFIRTSTCLILQYKRKHGTFEDWSFCILCIKMLIVAHALYPKRIQYSEYGFYTTDATLFVWDFICLLNWFHFEKQPSRDARSRRCSENMQQIYGRTPIAKSDSIKFALQLYWTHTVVWVFSCKFAVYFQSNFY